MAGASAITAYYRRIGEQARRAARNGAPAPDVPDHTELEFVDGLVVRNGRPVWCAATGDFVDLQAVAHPRQWRHARSAWIATLEERTGILHDAIRSAGEGHGVAGSRHCRRRDAVERAYYDSLAAQAKRAIRGQAAIPVVPPRSELNFVDGWLVWKGRPVWWSGQRQEDGPRNDAERKRDAAEPGVAAPPPPSRARPKRRRLIPLPWRRAA